MLIFRYESTFVQRKEIADSKTRVLSSCGQWLIPTIMGVLITCNHLHIIRKRLSLFVGGFWYLCLEKIEDQLTPLFNGVP